MDLLEQIQRNSAMRRDYESAGILQPGEEKAPGRPSSPFQGLKGIQESWRGTLDKGMEGQKNKGLWYETPNIEPFIGLKVFAGYEFVNTSPYGIMRKL
ncbi:hypothetical protein BTVI_104254 [Pitangus sulphuratus]|nr:hypothetical protein BTVI_104254 [Pitangus sulphuratus]